MKTTEIDEAKRREMLARIYERAEELSDPERPAPVPAFVIEAIGKGRVQ